MVKYSSTIMFKHEIYKRQTLKTLPLLVQRIKLKNSLQIHCTSGVNKIITIKRALIAITGVVKSHYVHT